VSAFGFAAGLLLLDFRLPACAAFGLALGAVGLRARDIWVGSNLAYYLMLLCGVNVPLERLPAWLAAVGGALPLTHGIQAARQLAARRASVRRRRPARPRGPRRRGLRRPRLLAAAPVRGREPPQRLPRHAVTDRHTGSASASGGPLIKRLIAALRRRLNRSQPRALMTDGRLQQFAAACEDLADDDVMTAAWR
jgi:ABC-2 type transporter